MTEILVRPPELRRAADQLRAGAEKIGDAVESVDADMRALRGWAMLGLRANRLQDRYRENRDALLRAKELTLTFATGLQIAADVMEKADSEMQKQLFVHDPIDPNDIDPSDVQQGNLGDCYLLAAIAAIARQNPELLRQMIHDNGDGTYTITFYQRNSILGIIETGFTKVDIKVSLDGKEYARLGDEFDINQEAWVQLIEKAYAQWKGGYSSIEGGYPSNAMETITGISSQDYNPPSLTIDALAAQFKNGAALTASSLTDYKIGPIDIPDRTDELELYKNNTLVANHAYTVTAVDIENGTVTVRNPWGFNRNSNDAEIVLSFEDFQKNFSTVSINTLRQ